MEKEKVSPTPHFNDIEYKDLVFRHQVLSQEGLGFCYLISNKFFIFTSSRESMEKIIDKIYE